MAVKIRLNRMGAKKNPFYRIVVADSRAPRDGRFIEILGHYDPSKQPALVNIDEEKAIDWMKKGAQPTDTVKNILSKNGTMAKFAEAKRDARFDGGISSHAEDFPSRAHTAMRRDDAHERDSRGYCEILGRSSGSCRR